MALPKLHHYDDAEAAALATALVLIDDAILQSEEASAWDAHDRKMLSALAYIDRVAHPRRTMQKIEIVITNDAGESSVIASTNRHSVDHCIYATNLSGHMDARKAMTPGEQMAVSRLCLNAAARMFAADPTDAACLAALAAFHSADKSMLKTSIGEAGGTVLPDGDTLLVSAPSPHAKA